MNNKIRFEEDRNRTINDYYRMNLDQTVDNEAMTKAYNAYLKNTPGSKQALTELLNKNRELSEKKNTENEGNDSNDNNETKNSMDQNNDSHVKHNSEIKVN